RPHPRARRSHASRDRREGGGGRHRGRSPEGADRPAPVRHPGSERDLAPADRDARDRPRAPRPRRPSVGVRPTAREPPRARRGPRPPRRRDPPHGGVDAPLRAARRRRDSLRRRPLLLARVAPRRPRRDREPASPHEPPRPLARPRARRARGSPRELTPAARTLPSGDRAARHCLARSDRAERRAEVGRVGKGKAKAKGDASSGKRVREHRHVDLFDLYESIHYREFKILLKAADFSDDIATEVHDYWKLARRVASQLLIHVKRSRDEAEAKYRDVVFLDTPGCDLYRNSFMLRIRRPYVGETPGHKYELTLKFRNSDIG